MVDADNTSLFGKTKLIFHILPKIKFYIKINTNFDQIYLQLMRYVLHLMNKISSNNNDKEFTGLCFLDLKKAFDTVSHDILLKNLIITVSEE